MNIFQTRKLIYASFVLLNLINNSYCLAFSEIFKKDGSSLNEVSISYELSSKSFISSSDYLSDASIENFADDKEEKILNESLNAKNQLEIQSDEQYQENNVIYANGNVLVTFKGNSLEADSLVYDKLNEKFEALGNIRLIIGSQIFNAESIRYDFKSQKGKLLKVKGFIKTNNLIENINFNSNDPNEISSFKETINKLRVLHTPNRINNWIFSADEFIVENGQWIAKKAFFTNDLLESDQVKFEINNLKITPEESNIKIKSSISFLVFEDKLPIPFWFGERTFQKSKEGYSFDFNSKWYLGTDSLDRDGYFIGRNLNPINLSDNFSLELEPQFLIERSIKGYTKSFVNKGDSVTAQKSKRDTFLADYFALNSKLRGEINNWDLKIEKKLYSFDSEKLLDALRFKVDLSKEISFLNSKWDKSFYGVYRDRIWNGSIGESEIYVGFGSKLEKKNSWEVNGIKKNERFTLGLGKFKGEGLNSKNLVSGYKGSIYYSLDQKFPVIVKEPKNKFVDRSFNYIYEPIKQGVYIDTKLAALYSYYENGNHQEYIGFGAGPELVIGEFKRKYLDYTRLSLLPFYRLKSGESSYKFDQISDQFTLNITLDQQLYGPLLLKTDATLNLDENSKDYGDFINSKISLNWKKRSYELGIFYQPHNQAGGINFTLNGFE